MIKTIRERQEEWENEYLSPYAALSKNSGGREIEETPCDIRPVYQRDRDRILHAKAFRRLKHKTQVFMMPRGDHYRTRLTHTLEVAQTARTIARALRLNEDLTEAIALGHDLGHTPFGHAGERALDQICQSGFTHYEQSIRVVELLEKDGKGLNLTKEVKDGILNHPTSGMPCTLEGKVVRLADKIAYVNHDIDDAIRAQILKEEDIPAKYRKRLGNTTRERLNLLIHDVIANSEGKADIIMSPDVQDAIQGLRQYMFENVYWNHKAKGEEEKAQHLLKELYRYYLEHIRQMPVKYHFLIEIKKEPEYRVVCDYIADMTDSYATCLYEELFIPKAWKL